MEFVLRNPTEALWVETDNDLMIRDVVHFYRRFIRQPLRLLEAEFRKKGYILEQINKPEGGPSIDDALFMGVKVSGLHLGRVESKPSKGTIERPIQPRAPHREQLPAHSQRRVKKYKPLPSHKKSKRNRRHNENL